MNLDSLKNLVLDAYYKVLIVVGFVIFAVSLVIDLKGITNQQGLLLGGALFLLGLGEWNNIRTIPAIKHANAYTGSATLFEVIIWRPTFLGLVFDILGIILGIQFIKSFY